MTLPVHIVGLATDYRGLTLEQQLSSHDVSIYRVPAFDARNLDAERLAELSDGDLVRHVVHRSMTSAEIGCAASHVRAYEAIVRSGAHWSVVMEDDARLTDRFGTIERVLATLERPRPTVLLLWAQADYAVVNRELDMVTDGASGRISIRQTVTPPVGAVAYAINLPAARLATERTAGRRIAGLADWPTSWSYDADFFLVWPWLAIPDPDARSTIQQTRTVFEEQGIERRHAKYIRHAEAAVGLRYLRKRSAYPGLKQAYAHEVLRPASLAFAKWSGRRLDDDARAPRRISRK